MMEMERMIFIALTVAFFSGLASCRENGGQEPAVTIPSVEETTEPEVSVSFNHPCAYVNAADLARVRQHVSAADLSDPVYASWKELESSPFAQETVKPSALETVVRGDPTGTGTTENYMQCCRQACAAFQLALRWQISGEEKYAESSRAILNEWAWACRKITANDSNQYLLAGFQGYTFANAAELLRGYAGWTDSEQESFKKWLRDVWYEKNKWFIDNHGGPNVCDLHYWSNWELCNLASILAIGIYLEDAGMVNYVNRQFLSGQGSGAVENLVPYDPVADPDGKGAVIAQCMESGRDQGHAVLCVSETAELCRMAQNVGLDFWGAKDSRVLAFFEYEAKYNVRQDGLYIASDMPFTEYKYCVDCSCVHKSHGATHTAVSPSGRGKERPGWDLIYAHYVKEKDYAPNTCYYTKLFAGQLRYRDGVLTGDGGAGDERYGSASGAFDQLGWGTLLFYQGE